MVTTSRFEHRPDDASPTGIHPMPEIASKRLSPILGYAVVPVMVGAAVLIAAALEGVATVNNLSLIFVLPVVTAGILLGPGPAFLGALLSALAFNFFFTEPRWTLQVEDPANVWAIALLFVVGCIASALAASAQRRSALADRRRRYLQSVRGLGRRLSDASQPSDVVSAAMDACEDLFEVSIMMVVIDETGEETVGGRGTIAPDPAALEAARSALAEHRMTPASTYPFDGSRFDFWPTQVGGTRVALGLAYDRNERPEDVDAIAEVVGYLVAFKLNGWS